MNKSTEVVAVGSRTVESGLEVEVTIVRSLGRYPGVRPSAEDVPPDIRKALLDWLSA